MSMVTVVTIMCPHGRIMTRVIISILGTMIQVIFMAISLLIQALSSLEVVATVGIVGMADMVGVVSLVVIVGMVSMATMVGMAVAETVGKEMVGVEATVGVIASQ